MATANRQADTDAHINHNIYKTYIYITFIYYIYIYINKLHIYI